MWEGILKVHDFGTSLFSLPIMSNYILTLSYDWRFPNLTLSTDLSKESDEAIMTVYPLLLASLY